MSGEARRQPWSAPERWALALLLVGVLGSLPLLVHPWYDSSYGDPALYITTARALVAGEGLTFLGLPFQVRPPGFTVMIAPVIAAFGTDFYALNLYISLLGAAGVLLLALLHRERLGNVLAVLTALAVWLNPGFRWLSTQVMSDIPGTSFLIASLLLERWARRSPSWHREVALGLSVGLAAYVRPFNLVLVPAIAVSRALRWRRDRAAAVPSAAVALRDLALFATVACMLLLPWSVHTRRHPPPAPADQTLVYSYGTGMWHRDPGDPNSPRLGARELLERVPKNLPAMASVLGNRVIARRRGPLDPVLGIFLLGCSLAVLWKRREPAEFYVVGAVGALAFYFDLRDRLLLPVFVLALPATVEVVRDLLGRLAGTRVATAGAAAAVLLLIAIDFEPQRGWNRIEQRHARYQQLASAVGSELEPDARIAAGVGFHYGVYLDRPVYSLWFALRRDNRPEVAEAIIDKYGLDTLLFSPLIGAEMGMLPYFEQRYGNVRKVGGASIVRVRPAARRRGRPPPD